MSETGPDLIDRYLDGDLDASEGQRLELALLEDDALADAVAARIEVREALQEALRTPPPDMSGAEPEPENIRSTVAPPVPPDGAQASGPGPRLAIAAAVLTALGLGVLFTQDESTRDGPGLVALAAPSFTDRVRSGVNDLVERDARASFALEIELDLDEEGIAVGDVLEVYVLDSESGEISLPRTEAVVYAYGERTQISMLIPAQPPGDYLALIETSAPDAREVTRFELQRSSVGQEQSSSQ